MIFWLSGVVRHVREQAVVLDVGPVGVLIRVPVGTRFTVGQSVGLVTYLHWNEEQGPSLFGFEHERERAVFTLIIGCSGMGPKSALAVLANLGAQGFVEAVAQSDLKALSRVSGIGPKKAEQLVVQLRNKVQQLVCSDSWGLEGTARVWQELSQALESLSYTRTEITHALSHLTSSGERNPQAPFDQLLREALGFLSKHARP